MNKKILLFCLVAILATASMAQNGDGSAASKQNDPKMQWWKDAKFGMFIHWGIYSVPAGKWNDKTIYGEWIMHQAKIPRTEYAALAKQFNPTQFNAEEWVLSVAPASGLTYVILLLLLSCFGIKMPSETKRYSCTKTLYLVFYTLISTKYREKMKVL